MIEEDIIGLLKVLGYAIEVPDKRINYRNAIERLNFKEGSTKVGPLF
ncbi:MAG: hypothetical protein U0V74_17150 [Chitinophagales bacterium]